MLVVPRDENRPFLMDNDIHTTLQITLDDRQESKRPPGTEMPIRAGVLRGRHKAVIIVAIS
jgi:hypothetical protein